MTSRPIREEVNEKTDNLNNTPCVHKPTLEGLPIKSHILESFIQAVAIAEFGGKLAYANNSFMELWGYDNIHEILGRSPLEFWKEQEKAGVVLTSLQSEERWVGDLVARRKDGSFFDAHLSASTVMDETGRPIYVMGSFIDVSECRYLENGLRRQEFRNQMILETAMDGFCVMDTEGKIVEANHVASEILGYSPEEIVGLSIQDLEVKETRRETRTHIRKIIKAGADRFETKHRHKKGWIVDLEVSVNLVEMSDEKFFFLFLRDLTERRQAERALKAKEQELEMQTKNLAEMNTAFRVLLNRRDEDKREIESKVLFNIRELVVPYLEELKRSGLNERQGSFVTILESNLGTDLISSFSQELSSRHIKLTPAEIKISSLIKQGNTTKEIADLLSLSVRTIETYRKNIRKKLRLTNQRENLRSYLLSIENG